jgi:O-acetylserine/cysteine efflux transporter
MATVVVCCLALQLGTGACHVLYDQAVGTVIGLSMRLSGERVQRFQWFALLLANAGIAIIGLHTDGSTSFLGLAMVLLAALSWAAGNMAAKQGKPPNMASLVGPVGARVWHGCAGSVAE